MRETKREVTTNLFIVIPSVGVLGSTEMDYEPGKLTN